ncbi:secondary thiamine-phosphate synthase enzyme YjbQ [Coprothermobacter platensis]|jgi:secondary thiamine-phosphate synthase enzyme|uniref:secondary thiamine-phosphate synthase enzyme YjbQ n=1 Tax=Coprothermobacter platensis TaxID=108819 RepID=UPI000364E7F9|nr:secondary thiamine-phosphate synthase enzyme YjbQ [Coprothermobacter platensis]
MIELTIKTSSRRASIDITKQVEDAVRSAGVSEGICTIYVPHTTAGLTINEHADPSVIRDVMNALVKLTAGMEWTHLEGNSDAHFLSSIVGTSITIPVHQSKLSLGTWQGIFFMEFDGPRQRKAYVQISESVRTE